ncbi:putative diacylglycerol kinase [Gregarina niphandrodes]|uniref:Diacylglycerol kinase n=1 Tax=Gregarina niphandrodes TaxID=110365 RepID=A0A023B9H9_GRENI|nr:putative diacylglycerol kinase [Gregarina niphandrodes]EZG72984.1 putative diacylglycerol kinase [Gregarina niphandrodes]|eukprot:XP_011129679.1 putative diacylglycerol kinase [Gregarina niphandrodes]
MNRVDSRTETAATSTNASPGKRLDDARKEIDTSNTAATLGAVVSSAAVTAAVGSTAATGNTAAMPEIHVALASGGGMTPGAVGEETPSEAASESALSSGLPRTPSIGLTRVPVGGGVPEVVRDLPRPNAFLFVNPTSGGNAAGCFTAQAINEQLVDELGGDRGPVRLHVADIREGSSGNKPMFLKLKKLVEDLVLENLEERVTVVMAGGDGTVLWGISEIWEHGIDDSYIVFGVIPFGTGNDFAKALNWQPCVIQNPFTFGLPQLRTLVSSWLDSKVILHDIWDLQIKLREGGCFKKIDSSTRQKIVLKDNDGQSSLIMRKKLNNYFSLGVESRIGIGFDRHRKQSAFRNKIVYVNEGVKKTLFHKPVVVSKMIRTMKTNNPSTGRLQTVFSSDPMNMTQRTLRKCASLIAINIPSFASGLDIWKNAHRIGLRDADSRALTKEVKRSITSMRRALSMSNTNTGDALDETFPHTPVAPGVPGSNVTRQRSRRTKLKRCICCVGCSSAPPQGDLAELAEANQQMGDGQLEWVTFGTVTSLGTEQVLEGLGRRIHQGGGPFTLAFHENLGDEDRVYYQIDGEFYIMTKPLE